MDRIGHEVEYAFVITLEFTLQGEAQKGTFSGVRWVAPGSSRTETLGKIVETLGRDYRFGSNVTILFFSLEREELR